MSPTLGFLALMLVGVAFGLGAAAVGLMAWSLAHPPRMTDGKATWVLRRLSPADLGLHFEDMRIDVRDEHGKLMRLAAWWIPHASAAGRCAVLVHGYADAKVGAIAWAPLWHGLGYNLLVPDLRGHGESEGNAFTAGFHERHDLAQLIDDCRARKPDEMREITLFGISAGAATALAVACERDDIAAVVLESPYADFRRAAMHHMDRLGAPGPFLQRAAISLAEWLTQADYAAIAPIALLRRVGCPVLLIQSGRDQIVSPADRAALDEIMRTLAGFDPADAWTVENADHLMGLCLGPARYEQRIREFLRRAAESRPGRGVFTPSGE